MEGPDQLRINNFALTYAEALTASARLLVPFDGRPIIGNVAVRSDDLAPVGRALRQQLAGRLNLDVVLDAARGTQRVAANLRGNDIRYGPTAAPIAGVDALRANVEAIDVQAERRLRADVNASNILAAGGHLSTASLRATGARNAYQVSAAAKGDLQGLTQFTADADISPAETTRVTLRRMQATLKDEALRLVRPARLAFGGDRLQVDDLALMYGKAQATLSATKTPRTVDGRLAVRDFDLSFVEKFQPGSQLSGVVNADAELTGTPMAPDAECAGAGDRPQSGPHPAERSGARAGAGRHACG